MLRTALVLSALLAPTLAFAVCEVNGVAAACGFPPLTEAAMTGRNEEKVVPAGAAAARILDRVTVRGQHSTCADGTPAVMYVRPGTTTAGRKRWAIVLEGGGNGFDPMGGDLDGAMWNRWTGGGSNPDLNWILKNSTDWEDGLGNPARDGTLDVPHQVVVDGMLDGVRSSFETWNLVFLNYCSSDGWTGAADGVEYDAGDWTDSGDAYHGFKMNHNGHRIIEKVVEMLDRPGDWGLDSSPMGVVDVMPDLEDAEFVLVAGESAGGGGVRYNLDFIADEIAAIDPAIVVAGSTGAAQAVPIGVPGDPWWVDADGNGKMDLQDGAEELYSQIQVVNGFVDASCEAGGGTWECLLLSEVLPDLSTPIHVKQDMSDPLVGTWLNYKDGVTSDYTDWRVAGDPAFFAPDCGRHDTLSTQKYYDHSLRLFQTTAGGPVLLDEVNYDESLRRFAMDVAGVGGPAEQIHHGLFTVPLTTRWHSNCP